MVKAVSAEGKCIFEHSPWEPKVVFLSSGGTPQMYKLWAKRLTNASTLMNYIFGMSKSLKLLVQGRHFSRSNSNIVYISA